MKHKGTEPEGIAIADTLGLRYEGIQKSVEGMDDVMLFTDVAGTGTTVAANTLAEAVIRLVESRQLFGSSGELTGPRWRLYETFKAGMRSLFRPQRLDLESEAARAEVVAGELETELLYRKRLATANRRIVEAKKESKSLVGRKRLVKAAAVSAFVLVIFFTLVGSC